MNTTQGGNPLNGNIFATTYNALNLPWQQYDPVPFDANNNTTITETKQNTSGGTVTDNTLNIYDNFDRLTRSTQRGIPISYWNDQGHIPTINYW